MVVGLIHRESGASTSIRTSVISLLEASGLADDGSPSAEGPEGSPSGVCGDDEALFGIEVGGVGLEVDVVGEPSVGLMPR